MAWAHWLGDNVRRIRRRKARRRAIQELRRSLVLIVDPEALTASVTNRLKELFDPQRVILCELEPMKNQFRVSFASPPRDPDEPAWQPLSADGRLARWLKVNETYLSLEHQRDVVEYLSADEQVWLERSGCQLCTPMMAKNQLIGLVLLGFDRPSAVLRQRDAGLLLQMAEQASLAFQNAALYREQQERLVRLHRADRLAAMGQLAAGVAHEVRNPLTAIRSTMQYVGSNMRSEQKEMVEELIGEVDRIDQIISDLLNLSRAGSLQRLPVNLTEVIDQTVRFLDHRARNQSARIVAESDGPIVVDADPNQLKQVFLNLILNALQAIPEGGEIRLEAGVEAGDPRDPQALWARVLVIDNGPGIPAEVLSQVLDPFFTTKSEGTGLGLSICHNIIEQHGGRLDIRSAEDLGTTVMIQLPMAAEATRALFLPPPLETQPDE